MRSLGSYLLWRVENKSSREEYNRLSDSLDDIVTENDNKNPLLLTTHQVERDDKSNTLLIVMEEDQNKSYFKNLIEKNNTAEYNMAKRYSLSECPQPCVRN